VGLLYVAFKVALLVLQAAGVALPDEQPISSTIIFTSCLLLALGASVPRWGAMAYTISQRRTLDRLWASVEPASQGTLEPDEMTADERRRFWDARFKLQRRIDDIENAIIALVPYRSAHARRAAEAAVGEAGFTGPLRTAAIDALLLSEALRVLKTGTMPTELDHTDPIADTQDIATRLMRLARAYKTLRRSSLDEETAALSNPRIRQRLRRYRPLMERFA
jgi:hypothetical protein